MTAGPLETIVALASGRPPVAVAVVRISGPRAFAILTALTARTLPPPRQLHLRRLRDPASGEALDDALVVRFAAPASATGDDSVELHLHGGVAVVEGVIDAVIGLGARLAEAGEFTRRAFDNGKLDLDRVEGLADLIDAGTAAQRSQALALAGGALGQVTEALRSRVLTLLANAEAALDFAEDEADVALNLAQGQGAVCRALAVEIEALLQDAKRGARVRDGLVIALVGLPNVGKSSLANALSRRDASIVTPLAGTTRDLIEVALDLGGVAAVLVDTAGLRESDDPVEQEGVRRARARAASADLVIHIADGPVTTPLGWLVINKIDVGVAVPDGAVGVSALTGAGVPELRARLETWAAGVVRPGEPALVSRSRHREALIAAMAGLTDAGASDDPVLRAEGLRAAATALGRITGRIGVEDVLGEIFGRFCVGK